MGMKVMHLDVAVANEWLVTLTEDVADLDATADALAARHGFAVSARLGAVRSFVATYPLREAGS